MHIRNLKQRYLIQFGRPIKTAREAEEAYLVRILKLAEGNCKQASELLELNYRTVLKRVGALLARRKVTLTELIGHKPAIRGRHK